MTVMCYLQAVAVVLVLRYLFELTAVAGVDDGVQAAVKVPKPENDFEKRVRRTQAAVERT